MSEDRRTKAEIREDLHIERERHQDLQRRFAELESKLTKYVPARPVPEADALAGCIRALDSLKDSERGSSFSYSSGGAVSRTILALCEKYGVPRFEKVTEPCTRRHVEDLSAVDVLTAVRRDLEGLA